MHFLRSVCTGIRYIWKTITLAREITANILFFLILLFVFGAIELISDFKATNIVSQSGVLVLDIEGTVVDSISYDQNIYELSKKLSGNKSTSLRENSLFEIIQKIDQASSDPEIRGIILKLDNFAGADLPSLEYIAKYLMRFKKTGKPIYAMGGSFNQKQYYLASLADQIYLTRQGNIALYGFAANNLYFKSLLDNLKIDTHIFRVGIYKSAIEPFVRDDMSETTKENTARWLNTMWHNYLTDIAQYRKQAANNLVPTPDIMLKRLKAVSGNIGKYALANGIIDHISSHYQFEQEMNRIFHNATQLSIYDYQLNSTKMQLLNHSSSSSSSSGTTTSSTTTLTKSKPRIAVVFINGSIATGDSENSVAGSDTITRQLRDIGNNQNIYAVVLRINSPGGGVYASETIRSELEALRSKGIPVVVSMGGVAASGGYWIATESDYVIASPNTLTGSIGIFGIIPTFENSLSYLGIHTDGVSTSPLAEINVTKELPDEFNQFTQMNIENGYDNFISLVATSRGISSKNVEQIAQGQVWLGEEAKAIGLVDELGDFDTAVKKAATLAKISDYTIDWQQQKTDFISTFLGNYFTILPKSVVEIIYNQSSIAQQIKARIAFWDNLNDPQNRYIYCLNCADIK